MKNEIRLGMAALSDDVISSYAINNTEELERYISNISKDGFASEEDAREYVNALIDRYKKNNPPS